MCYGTCKYEHSFGTHEMTGECSIYHLLGTNNMPEDATCMNPTYGGEECTDTQTKKLQK